MRRLYQNSILNRMLLLISGAALALAFPKANLHFLAWFALAPLIYSIYRQTLRGALVSALVFGFGFFAALVYWIALFGKLPWLALAAYQALFVVGFAATARLAGNRPWARLFVVPSAWVLFEWLRAQGMFGFTWGDLGYSQYQTLPVIQIASFAGVWGVSYLLALSNAALADLAERGPSPRTALAAALVLGSVLYGRFSMPSSGGELTAAIVQGNISQNSDLFYEYAEESWGVYSTMTERLRADIIVWPETAVPGFPAHDRYVAGRLARLARVTGARLLAGAWDEEGERAYNSAFLVGPTGVTGKYSKVHLVPFGEFVPARKYLPFLSYYRVRPQDTSPGPGFRVLDAGKYKIGAAICFESAFPEIARALTDSGANILCVITDDEWFGNSAAAEQHLAKSVLRAVENRRWVLRAAATGISCVVDPAGRVPARAGLWERKALSHEVGLRSGKTPYTRFGDWLVLVSGGVCALALFRRRV
ncbi:MAG: apolipoprotein N-acyltransferase [Armatimonadota bacterium]